MKIMSFKDLIVWKKSLALVKEIYFATSKMPQSEMYGLVSQMRRSAVSIPSNISEGYQRKNRKEYLYFLHISRGSAAELETQMLICKEIYPKIDFTRAENLLVEIQKMLHAIISKLT
jgi:four helix bundle protein